MGGYHRSDNTSSTSHLPPPLGNIGNTHTRFLDQVSELVQYSLTNHKNLVLLGDFNIAVQDLSNPDNVTYRDTMEALGLHQHISIPHIN